MSNTGMLQSLYPFLHGREQDAEKLRAALLHSVAEKAAASRDTNARFFAEQGEALVAAAGAVAAVYRGGGRLYAMGNGGSSCDAAHIAVEFTHPVTAGRPARWPRPRSPPMSRC
jgi:D-sedoheptulose 7-phosphate isomerase